MEKCWDDNIDVIFLYMQPQISLCTKFSHSDRQTCRLSHNVLRENRCLDHKQGSRLPLNFEIDKYYLLAYVQCQRNKSKNLESVLTGVRAACERIMQATWWPQDILFHFCLVLKTTEFSHTETLTLCIVLWFYSAQVAQNAQDKQVSNVSKAPQLSSSWAPSAVLGSNWRLLGYSITFIGLSTSPHYPFSLF